MIPQYLLRHDIAAPPGVAALASLSDEAWAFHRSLRLYQPTPLHHLDALARRLGIGALWLKDESPRFGLNAFKGLGASFAMHRWLATHDVPADAVFTTATDGNHGRAVSWMARQSGYRAVIFMPAYSVRARIEAIENEGAKVVLVPEGYDAAVAQAQAAAHEHGWIVIQDTTTEHYREVSDWIEAGYWTMARELEPVLHGDARADVDVVLLHAGVGTWPAAMVQYYWHRYESRRPRILVVEPVEAACVIESVAAGHAVGATGSLRTIMAGLNCGFPSLSALDVLRDSVDGFMTIGDQWTEKAMRALAQGTDGDPVVVAGESGAASVAALLALADDPAYAPLRDHMGIDRNTRVLVWSTEGATDPDDWERVVGRPVPS